jgi:hypothetical protein
MTPMAYAVTSRPAVPLETDKSCATFGSKPAITNSAVPSAKLPSANAISPAGIRLVGPPGDFSTVVCVVSDISNSFGAGKAPSVPSGTRWRHFGRDPVLLLSAKCVDAEPEIAVPDSLADEWRHHQDPCSL